MKAKLRFVRISPRKIRPVAELVRGKPVDRSLAILKFCKRKGARILEKVIRSAVANAVENNKKDEESLYVGEVRIDEGPRWKRYRPVAYGRAHLIRKRTSHIFVRLEEKE